MPRSSCPYNNEIPLLPGGGGTVEAALAFGLITHSGAKSGIVAGVILFRIISAWGLVPIGWAAWALSRTESARA